MKQHISVRNQSIRLLLAFSLMTGVVFCGCGQSEEETGEAKTDVEVILPEVRDISLSADFIATIETDDKAYVTPKITGVVTSRNYLAGDHVNAGDVLFTLDDSELQIEKKTAEANVKSAEASLAAQKARNEETKASAEETVATADTRTLELYNSIKSNEREESAAAIRRDGYSQDVSLYDSEGRRISRREKDAKNRAEEAREFTDHLTSQKEAYRNIANAASLDEAKSSARKYGVSDDAMQAAASQQDVADIYIKTKTQYESSEQLQTAIDASKETEKTAENDKSELEGSYNANMVSRLEAEVNARLESGNLANAQEAKALAQRLITDYELFTKKTLLSDAKAKVAEGDASVTASGSQLTVAQTELESINLKLDNTTVRSPISGIVQEVNIEPYGMATDQTPAYVIFSQDGKKAVFYVTEDVKDGLKEGQNVIIKKNDMQYDAKISMIGDTPDEQKKLYKVSASIDSDAADVFDQGITIKLSTSIKTVKNAVTLPIGAVYYSEGKPYVYTAQNGKAVRTGIETGISDKVNIQVLSGLSPQDQVITSWTSQLKDQSDINVKNTPTAKKMNLVETEIKTEEPVNPENNEENHKAEEPFENEITEEPAAELIETTDKVHIRQGKGTDTESLALVPAGEKLTKLGEEDGWTKVSYNGQEAFIKSDYVKECEHE